MSKIYDFSAMADRKRKQAAVKSCTDAAQHQRERAQDLKEEARAAALLAMLTGDAQAAADAITLTQAADNAAAAAADHERAAQRARENAEKSFLMDLQELAAIVEHDAAADQPTQNADGVRVGDLFCEAFGYDMTINRFYQVVALKGKKTAIIRRVASSITQGDGMSGRERACRNAFADEQTFARRTGTSTDGHPRISSGEKHRHLWPTTEFEEHYFNTLD